MDIYDTKEVERKMEMTVIFEPTRHSSTHIAHISKNKMFPPSMEYRSTRLELRTTVCVSVNMKIHLSFERTKIRQTTPYFHILSSKLHGKLATRHLCRGM